MDDNSKMSCRVFESGFTYVDKIDLAVKLIHLYNGYLRAMNEEKVVSDMYISLLSYYMVYGYSYKTKERYSRIYGKKISYVSVLDTKMKKDGFLHDYKGTFRSRNLCVPLARMKRFFIDEQGDFDGNHLWLNVFRHV